MTGRAKRRWAAWAAAVGGVVIGVLLAALIPAIPRTLVGLVDRLGPDRGSAAARAVATRGAARAAAGVERQDAFRLTAGERRQFVGALYRAFEEKQRLVSALADRPDSAAWGSAAFRIDRPGEHGFALGTPSGAWLRRVRLTNDGETAVWCTSRLTPMAPDAPVAVRDAFGAASALAERSRDHLVGRRLALALFTLVRDGHVFRAQPAGEALRDPQRFLRGFGFGQCGDAAEVLAKLAARAGLEARVVHLGIGARRGFRGSDSHAVTEIRYTPGRGRWRLFDPSKGLLYLADLGDGWVRLADAADVKADPDIVRRTLVGRDRTPLGQWTVDRLTAFHRDAVIDAEAPVPARPGRSGRWMRYVRPDVLLGVDDVSEALAAPARLLPADDGPRAIDPGRLGFNDVRPIRLEWHLRPGASVELTNELAVWPGRPRPGPATHPGSGVPPETDLTHAPPRAVGTIEEPFRDGTAVPCPFDVLDLDVHPTAARDSVEVSFDAGRTWIAVANREALRAAVAAQPRFGWTMRSRGASAPPAGTRVTATVGLSPFVFGSQRRPLRGAWVRVCPLQDRPADLRLRVRWTPRPEPIHE